MEAFIGMLDAKLHWKRSAAKMGVNETWKR